MNARSAYEEMARMLDGATMAARIRAARTEALAAGARAFPFASGFRVQLGDMSSGGVYASLSCQDGTALPIETDDVEGVDDIDACQKLTALLERITDEARDVAE